MYENNMGGIIPTSARYQTISVTNKHNSEQLFDIYCDDGHRKITIEEMAR
ncbi:hypothetical protein yberc0001_10140 [Yersinia bercovieri ATCC 43970]|uniref:Uncharacterized protein n=1 Tax=Yersinia bercovieri ATCC 43970 TaxID=349968 RepID=A0ABM9Y3S4_YERBE|nr:hypothetical protein yberc0001_10140 [Yersinia bercovieri ATCC 43970]